MGNRTLIKCVRCVQTNTEHALWQTRCRSDDAGFIANGMQTHKQTQTQTCLSGEACSRSPLHCHLQSHDLTGMLHSVTQPSHGFGFSLCRLWLEEHSCLCERKKRRRARSFFDKQWEVQLESKKKKSFSTRMTDGESLADLSLWPHFYYPPISSDVRSEEQIKSKRLKLWIQELKKVLKCKFIMEKVPSFTMLIKHWDKNKKKRNKRHMIHVINNINTCIL